MKHIKNSWISLIASAGNRTRVNCLEGSYAHHYTTDAATGYNQIRNVCDVVIVKTQILSLKYEIVVERNGENVRNSVALNIDEALTTYFL